MKKVNQTPQESSSPSPFTCMICFTPFKYLPAINFGCVHAFCTSCMIKYIKEKLDNNISDIKCPKFTCGLEPVSCRRQIGPKLFTKWCDVLCESSTIGLDRVYCPNVKCSDLIINECGDGDKLKRCVCPNCKKPFCFQCRVAWHDGYTCDKSREMLDQNDIAFCLLSKKYRWTRCPRCRHCVELVDGCATVRCRCGIEFCHECGKITVNHTCTCLYGNNPWVTGFFVLIFLLVGVMVISICLDRFRP